MSTTTAERSIAKRLLAGEHPRMVGKTDLVRVAEVAGRLPADAVLLEMGPWLGYLSAELAQHGQLHVVDNFQWTKHHAKRVPDMWECDRSFRPLFEAIMDELGHKVSVHESAFADFAWSGPQIDLLVIDSPKSGEALKECLAPVVGRLSPGAAVLIKNGLNPVHHDMMAFVQRMVGAGLFHIADSNDATASNMLELRAANVAEGQTFDLDALLDGEVDADAAAESDAFAASYRLVQLAQWVEAGDWPAAYGALDQMKPDMGNIKLWESMEHAISMEAIQPIELAAFSEILIQHNTAADGSLVDGATGALGPTKAYWLNNRDKPWRFAAMKPAIIQRASAFGYLRWPDRISDHLRGKDVLDVGCGSGLHGIGYLCHGAQSTLGVDPDIRMDRDRVKNLAAKSREAFGWTPDELSDQMPPWQVAPTRFDALETARTFDLAIFHDCLAHVGDVPATLAKAAGMLREGGKVIIRHKNFYCWNGHSQQPKTVGAINLADEEQSNLVDWNHLSWDAPEDHYIRRSLNRVRLDDLLGAVNAHFDVVEHEEILSTEKTGIDRLTPDIRARFPELSDRDFQVQTLFLIAKLR